MAHDQTAAPEVKPPDRQLSKPSIVFGLVAIALAVLGVVLLVAGNSWVPAVGIALIALAGLPAVIGFGRLSNAAMSRRAARRRPFA
jgi:CHASE2 domain-containing sensor protein